MKRNLLYASMLVAGMTVWTSCDHEPNFPGLDVKGKTLTNVVKYAETYIGETFTAEKPANETLPQWLKSKYYTCDAGSFATVTYKYQPATSEQVLAFANAGTYTVTKEDYQTVWGDLPFAYFSPQRKAEQYVSGFLKTKYPTPLNGDLAVVYYNQAESEGEVDGETFFSEDFESKTLDKWKTVVLSDASANKNNWQPRSYSNNYYTQITAYNTKQKGVVESYLISATKIDIKNAKAKLTFDALYANYVATGGTLSVYVSENLTALDKAAVEAATWTELTSNFKIATSATGSGDMTPAGEASLAAFAGKQVYLAFKYKGDNSDGVAATSTVRIDNVLVQYGELKVAESAPEAACYKYEGAGDKWVPYAEVLVLQPQDYEAMGVARLTAASAPAYLTPYLNAKFPYAQTGTVQTVVFKTGDEKHAAIELQKSAEGWGSTSAVVEMTDEYEYDGAEWKYKRTVPKAALQMTFDEDGRKITAKETTMLEGWINVGLGANQLWYDKSYKNNNYTEATAYKVTDGALDNWLITPELEVKSNYVLKFDMTSGHWTHDALHVYISTSFSGKKEDVKAETGDTWVEITEQFNLPKSVGAYGKWENTGSYSLSEYAGKKVYIAFRYLGDAAKNETSTVQLDNIYVGE